MLKKFLSVATLLIISLVGFSQSTTIKAFEEKNANEGYNFFLYQSYIRMLNKDNSDDFNKLIEDLEYMKIILTDSAAAPAKKQYNVMAESIITEKYDELLMVDNKDMKASIYQKESRNGELELVALVYSKVFGRTGAFEMKGSLDLDYIGALEKSLDMEKLMELAKDQQNR